MCNITSFMNQKNRRTLPAHVPRPHPSRGLRASSPTRTTQLYNRLREEISLDDIERIHI